MGQALLRLCREQDTGCEVVAAVARRVDVRVIDGVPQFTAAELTGVPAFDVAIDFSLPEGFDAILSLCMARGVAASPVSSTGASAVTSSMRRNTLSRPLAVLVACSNPLVLTVTTVEPR